MVISGIQYMRPSGRPSSFQVEVPDELRHQWDKICKSNIRLASEMLMDGTISVTLEDDEHDHAIELVPNEPGKPVAAVVKLISEFKESQ